ncbi:MAG: SLBB domain-containing protein [Deltaproteobacteria bacterium]|nr:SLBB domain-containing protein [Deltaproteobacteria bacterium]
MYRIISLALSLFILFLPFSVSFAQSNRYRVPTAADQPDMGPAPSFRGGERQIQGQYPVQGQPGGTLSIPSSVTGSVGGALGGTTAGEAALISMGYQVHVLGEVMKPGTYRVSASDRVSEVISKAGGFAVNGSERGVELRRKGGGTTKLDLLSYRLFGHLNQNPYVTDNDVVFVPLRKHVIQVVGSVRRPDFYEVKNENTLKEVIELAGGFNAAVAKNEPIRVIRFEDGEKKVNEIIIADDALRRFEIENGDVVVIPNMLTKDTEFDYNVAAIPGDQVFYPSYEDRVFVLGGVAFPGAYPFSPYYTLNQYITLAGGLSDRGTDNYKITSIDGKAKRGKPDDRVNPGDTIRVKQKVMSNAAWAGFGLSLASFGLAASSTILAITK